MGAGCSSDCSKVQPYSTLSRPDEVDDGRKAYEAAQKAANRKKITKWVMPSSKDFEDHTKTLRRMSVDGSAQQEAIMAALKACAAMSAPNQVDDDDDDDNGEQQSAYSDLRKQDLASVAAAIEDRDFTKPRPLARGLSLNQLLGNLE